MAYMVRFWNFITFTCLFGFLWTQTFTQIFRILLRYLCTISAAEVSVSDNGITRHDKKSDGSQDAVGNVVKKLFPVRLIVTPPFTVVFQPFP